MRLLTALAAAFLFVAAAPVAAFDYLEHSYFGDRACGVAQEVLGERIREGRANQAEVDRYFALAVVCPNRRPANYCADDVKQAEANLNRLAEPGELAATFGDFAALPDHVSRFGPVRGMPAPADEMGLLATAFEWLASEPEALGGIIGDVAENACESEPTPWARVETDVTAYLTELRADGGRSHESAHLSPLTRAQVPRGPRDPAGVYSFDNPHFLDLVLNDRNHFGERAFGTWLGFHSTAVDLAGRSCEQVMGFDGDALADLAEGLPAFADLDWDALQPAALRAQGCAVLAERVRRRLLEWRERADPAIVAPVAGVFGRYAAPGTAALDAVVVGVMALVFEGSGLHYLQDGLSAGHLRTTDSQRALENRRFEHDFDNRHGITARTPTAGGENVFVAYGDSYLLGQALTESPDCTAPSTPEAVSDCLIRKQRGILVAASTASVLDWSLGGPMYGDVKGFCGGEGAEARLICRSLPLGSTRAAGYRETAATDLRLIATPLAVPPPPFTYQSFTMNASMDAAGSANQLGLDMAFYSAIGRDAGWLTSYRYGLRMAEGEREARRFSSDFGYGFHYRWAARFLLDFEPFVYAGFRGVSPDREFEMGIGPKVGFTALPEGWVKIPLEIGFAYRLPFRLLTTEDGVLRDAVDLEAHWLQITLGLAFM